METIISVAHQDTQLINDIIDRNYYKALQDGSKTFDIIFYNKSDNYLTEYCICHLEDNIYKIKEVTFDRIFEKFEFLINLYKRNSFKCDINLIGLDYSNKFLTFRILDLLLNNFKDNENIFTIKLNSYLNEFNDLNFQQYLNFIDLFNKININFKCNIYINPIIQNDLDRLKTFIDLKHKIILNITHENLLDTFNFIVNICKDKNYEYIFSKIDFKISSSSDWTDEDINVLLKIVEFKLIYCQKELKTTENIIKFLLELEDFDINTSLVSLKNKHAFDETNKYECEIHKHFTVRVNDLTVVVCPGLCQELMQIGEFDDNYKIKPLNISNQIVKDYAKPNVNPNCEHCTYLNICTGYCLSQSWIELGNELVPIPETCELKKSIYIRIIAYIIKIGGIQIIKDLDIPNDYKRYLLSFVEGSV